MIEIKYVAKNDEKTDPILILPNGTILRTMTNDLNGQHDRQRTFLVFKLVYKLVYKFVCKYLSSNNLILPYY